MLVRFRLLFQYHEITDVSYKGTFVAHYKKLLLPKTAIFCVVQLMYGFTYNIAYSAGTALLYFTHITQRQNMDDTTS